MMCNSFKLFQEKLLAIIVVLLIWEISSGNGLVNPAILPPPSIVFSTLYKLSISGVLLKHISISLLRVFGGFSIAALTAIPLGFIVGWFKTFEIYLDPLLQAMRQFPSIILFPVFITLIGIGENSKIVIIALACFWSIFLNTVNGVQNVDPILIKSARSIGISHIGMFRKVVLPAAVPSIFTGLRYAGTVSLMTLVAAEMIGSTAGLGFLVINSQERSAIPNMYAAIMALTILGVVINYLLIGVERSVSKWKEDIEYLKKVTENRN